MCVYTVNPSFQIQRKIPLRSMYECAFVFFYIFILCEKLCIDANIKKRNSLFLNHRNYGLNYYYFKLPE